MWIIKRHLDKPCYQKRKYKYMTSHQQLWNSWDVGIS